MNEDQRHEDALLEQVENLLERGKPSPHQTLNTLANTVPKADHAFRESLNAALLAQLQSQSIPKEKPAMQMAVTAKRPVPNLSSFTWAATLVAIILVSGLMFYLNRPSPLSGVSSAQTEDQIQLVIAVQDIPPGTVITADMVGLVSLSAADLAKLPILHPGGDYFTDVDSVIGQKAAVDIFWFAPIAASLLGEPLNPCEQPGASCPDLPEGYYSILFPVEPNAVQGLKAGDRVDVLGIVEGQLQVIVENILLADVQEYRVNLAAPSWQHSILVWLSQTGQPLVLRLYTGETAATDTTLVDYTFTAPEVLPDDYKFDLIVELTVSKGYLLTGLPAVIDNIPYTQRDTIMNFWFKNLELVSVENGTTVTIRLPQADADNLDYLLHLPTSLSFVPDEDSY